MARSSPDQESGPELARLLRKRWVLLDLIANLVGVLVVLTFLHAFHSAQDPAHGSADGLSGTGIVVAYLASCLARWV